VPNDLYSSDDEDEPDVRVTQRMSDKRRTTAGEHSDSEDEDGGRRNRQSYKDRSSLMAHDRGDNDMEVDEEEGEADDEAM
jgi:hypothetical protein